MNFNQGMEGPIAGSAKGSFLTWIWLRCRSFVAHVIMVVLVGLFMRFYVDGRQFLLSHNLTLEQADGTITHERILLPVQRDITTIISIFASTARAASTLWLAGIDLRCVFLFMQRGGMTYDGLKGMFGRSLPGSRHFRQKTNFIILAILHLGIFASTYTSSVLAGSVTWKAASAYRPGQPITGIPRGHSGDLVFATRDSRLLDTFVAYSTSVYSIFYGDANNRDSTSMHRLVPDKVRSLPNGSKFENVTVPYFAVEKFEWIKDPTTTLSSTQLASANVTNSTGPRVMNLRKWGFIPDGNWGPTENTFPAPLTVSESRILVIWTGSQRSTNCTLNPTIPSDVRPYLATLSGLPSCFIFANVTYQAGAASCQRCQVSGTGVIQDVGDVKSLKLVEDSVTSSALAIAPYVSTALVENAYAVPLPPAFPNYQDRTIEMLSRSYQVAWNSLTSLYALNNNTEISNVSIAVGASTANVLMWRVALWGSLHAILVGFGFLFRYMHTRGGYPWIEDPVTAALLVDPTSLLNETKAWAGDITPHAACVLKVEQDTKGMYLVLEDAKEDEKV